MGARRMAQAAAASLIVLGVGVVGCDDGKDDIPPGALLTDGQSTTVEVGESVWVLSSEHDNPIAPQWYVEPQEHMIIEVERRFVTVPCDGDETGCPAGYDGFLVSFDEPGSFVVKVIMCDGSAPCNPPEALVDQTYRVEVVASAG